MNEGQNCTVCRMCRHPLSVKLTRATCNWFRITKMTKRLWPLIIALECLKLTSGNQIMEHLLTKLLKTKTQKLQSLLAVAVHVIAHACHLCVNMNAYDPCRLGWNRTLSYWTSNSVLQCLNGQLDEIEANTKRCAISSLLNLFFKPFIVAYSRTTIGWASPFPHIILYNLV